MSVVTKTQCETCHAQADQKQMRHEGWVRLDGELQVWLEKPRTKGHGFMHSVGFSNHRADFCSVDCLIKALNAKESIP